MKIIDKYIVRQFFATFLFGLSAITLIFIVINLFEQMGKFIDQNVPAIYIIEYYIVFAPEIVKLMSPVAVLLSGLYTAGKMSSLNELTAIKAAGVSFYRYLIPFLIVSFLLSTFLVYFGGYVVPDATKRRIEIEKTYMKMWLEKHSDKIFFQDSKTRLVKIDYFDTATNTATKVGIQDYHENDYTVMTRRIDAAKMVYDTTKANWVLTTVVQRSFSDSTENVSFPDTLVLTDLNFSPDDVLKKQSKPEEMTLAELENYANEQLASGNDPTRILIEYHSRFAFAYASFIVVLFGLTISANKRKGGMAIQIGISIGITFIYMVLIKVFEAYGKNGVLNPMLTSWMVNFLFLAGGIINLLRVEK
ncbi:MAG: LptF/LptG family permease [Rhodothermaceae bacterium]